MTRSELRTIAADSYSGRTLRSADNSDALYYLGYTSAVEQTVMWQHYEIESAWQAGYADGLADVELLCND